LGNGDGTFQSPVDYGVGDANSLAVADLNGDGNPDAAVADPSNSSVAVYLGDGTGGFPTGTSYNIGAASYPTDVAIGDVNGDQIPDLVAIDENKKQLAALLGNGNGTFHRGSIFSAVAGLSPSILVLGDFNKDGKLDAATADFDKNTVSVLLGNGDGSFQTGQSYGVGDFPLGLAVGDFNNDQFPDLVTVNFDSYDVSVLLNAGTGGGGPASRSSHGSPAIHAGITELVHMGQPARGDPPSVGVSPTLSPVAIPPELSRRIPPMAVTLSAMPVSRAAPDALFAGWDDSLIQEALSAESMLRGMPSSVPIGLARPTMTRARATGAAGTYRGT
jgi:hypothetical protein